MLFGYLHITFERLAEFRATVVEIQNVFLWIAFFISVTCSFHLNPFKGFGASVSLNLTIPINLTIAFYNSL